MVEKNYASLLFLELRKQIKVEQILFLCFPFCDVIHKINVTLLSVQFSGFFNF